MPGFPRYMQDDRDVTSQSIQSVDYLSHCWVEEDLWTSWRYVISKGHDLPERSRLENASWRSWAKIRNDFGTIPPSAINWLKISDVTWLYGPLQAGPKCLYDMNRSISSVMLLKTEVPTMQAQYAGQRTLRHCILPADRILYYIDDSKVKVSNNKLNATPRSTDLCETILPCLREKRVRFSERVQQCISLGSTDGNIDDISARHCNHDTIHGINMAFIKRKRQSTSSRSINIRNEQSRSTMIAKLPATALKGSHIDISRGNRAMKRSAVIPTSATASPPSVQVHRPLGTQQPYSYYFSEDLDGDGDGNSLMGEEHGLVSGGCYQGLQDPSFTRRGYDPIIRLYTNSINTPELCMDGSQSYGGASGGGGGGRFRAIVDAINRAYGIVRDAWGVLSNRYW